MKNTKDSAASRERRAYRAVDFVLLSLLSAVCFQAVGWSQAATYTVSGTVVGPAGPIAGSTVNITSWDHFHSRIQLQLQRTTDASGRFSGDVPEGTVDVSVQPPSASGLLSDQLSGITVPPGRDIRFTLSRSVTLSGRTVSSDGQPVNVSYALYSLSTSYSRFLQPNAQSSTSFSIQVPADRYSIHAIPSDSRYSMGRINIDARAADQQNLTITVSPNSGEPFLTQKPPRAALISVSNSDANGIATVAGGAGSVEGMGSVVVVNLLTHQANLTVSQADGSFSLSMFAPPGSYLEIKQDPTGRYLPQMALANGNNPYFESPAGTILYVPPSGDPSTAVSTGFLVDRSKNILGVDYRQWQMLGVDDPGQAWITATIDQSNWAPGGTIAAHGTLSYYSSVLTDSTNLSAISITGQLWMDRIIDANGNQLQPQPYFMSPLLTPTGFPIERYGRGIFAGNWTLGPPRRAAGNRVDFDWSFNSRLSSNLPAGIYRPSFLISTSGLPQGQPQLNVFPTPEGSDASGSFPIVRVGQPAKTRLIWMLGLNNFSDGSRGALAAEDYGKFQFASHVKTNTDQFVVPMTDVRTGAPIRYRLEPFLPMVSRSEGRINTPPQIPFKFPSGNLSVSLVRPDGSTEDLGSAPFLQNMSRSPVSFRAKPIGDGASAHVTDLYELTTLDPRFEYTFKQYGTYRVAMRGTIEDIYGNVYEGGGTYEVVVARSLSIDTGVVPGAPFEVGNVFSPVVHLLPGVPADIDIRLRLLPNSDASKAIERHIQGRANRFGYFDPVLAEPLQLTSPGEYRVDITASYTDDQGVRWQGAVTWGSVVETPNSSLITHGRRGFDLTNQIQQQWFFVRDVRTGGDHVMYPFNHGDVMWMEKEDPAADVPKISIQDAEGSFAARVLQRRSRQDPLEGPPLADRIAAGEIPLFSSTRNGASPSFDHSAIDEWGYYYAFAERPGIHVREFVSEDFISDGYWRFKDNYQFQTGNGVGGDLPNDFKFHFGGAVYRAPADNFYYYGAYASMFVMLPQNDPQGGRVFPPFQGASGGPSGGPIMRLKGKDIDIFFHPTGTRPGNILELGDTASFSGHVAPTLPSQVRITITSPTGRIRQISGKANKVGYFYLPATDFVVDESGPYRVSVTVFHDGATSAGNVKPPFPTGDVLGSAQGQFDFYVVSASAPLANVNVPRDSFRRPAFEKIAISASPAATLTNVQLRYTTVMPGFILEEGSGSNLTYTYDASTLQKTFPNIDLNDADGFTGQDSIIMSMLVSGRDAAGRVVYQARQVFLAGEELLALPAGVRAYSLPANGALSVMSSGAASTIQTGYGRIQPSAGANAPTGMAIFGFRQNGVLVTEAAVPASALLRSIRIPAEVNGPINTGVAIANPNDQDAVITYNFTDSTGKDFGNGTAIIPANGQSALFLNQSPFNLAQNAAATLTINSSVPVASVALRGRTNERADFLLSTLPVIDLSPTASAPNLLPHFVDGGGWTTEVTLVNPSDQPLTGTLRIRDQAGAPLQVNAGAAPASSFPYTLAPRSSFRLRTSGGGSQIQAGSVRIEPGQNQITPRAYAVFTYSIGEVAVTEASVAAANTATSFRLYAESSSGIQTGLALANAGANDISVTVEALRLDGSSTGLSGSLRIPANGQTALFADQIPGLQSVASGFQGVLRVSTAGPNNLVVAGLRGRANERGDFLITTLPAQSEAAPPSTSELVFPHFADGGGYTTQFILMPVSGNTSGTLKFFGTAGQWLQPLP